MTPTSVSLVLTMCPPNFGYSNLSNEPFTPLHTIHRRDVVVVPVFSWKKGCFSASAGVILLSGLRARQRSNKSWNRLRCLASTSSMPLDAAMRRVRRSRVGFTTFRILILVCWCSED